MKNYRDLTYEEQVAQQARAEFRLEIVKYKTLIAEYQAKIVELEELIKEIDEEIKKK